MGNGDIVAAISLHEGPEGMQALFLH